MSCPDLLALSQLVDGEVAEAEGATLRAHTASCATCSRRIERLDRARTALAVAADEAAASAEAVAASAPASARSAGCLSPTEIAAWLDGGAGDGEQRRRSLHLESCTPCLAEALVATRILRRLSTAPMVAVPGALKARVASRWPVAEESGLTALVIRVTRAGARFLERNLVAPVIEIVDLASPAPALRAGGEAPALRFQLQAAQARIDATVEPVGDAVSLTLVLEGASSRVLPDQRVFLRRHGRSIYSARTDAGGVVRMPDLARGVYEVSFPGIATAFRIDLRA